MKKRKKQKVGSARRNFSRSGPTALHARFLTLALSKRIARMTATGPEDHQSRGQALTREDSSVGGIFPGIIKQFECMRTESLIEQAVQFLADNYKDLTSDQIKTLEQTILEDLEAYDNYCG